MKNPVNVTVCSLSGLLVLFILPLRCLSPLNVGGLLIEVDPRETELTVLCDIIIRAPSGEALPTLVEEIKAMKRIHSPKFKY